MTHTPGPWQYAYGDVWAIARIDGEAVNLPIMRRVSRKAHEREIPPTEKDANMRLAAAAPDLFSELALIVDSEWGERFENDEDINGGDLVEFMAERWPHIKAAVEKARG